MGNNFEHVKPHVTSLFVLQSPILNHFENMYSNIVIFDKMATTIKLSGSVYFRHEMIIHSNVMLSQSSFAVIMVMQENIYHVYDQN